MASVITGAYDHAQVDCADGGTALEENVTPPSNDTYYLVVPHNQKVEGSYCTDSAGAQRPRPVLLADRCTADQVVSACP